jgi:tetratricopeptide (TPR) repeat protein
LTHSRAAASAALCVQLAACVTAPPPAAPAPEAPRDVAPRPEAPAPAYEQAWIARATALERQGRLAEAAFAWQVVVLLRPEHRERLAELNQRIDALAGERLQRARQAQAKGDVATAERSYLGVLALRPDHAEAAASLRGIERARMSQDLGQPSRLILTRRAPAYPAAKPAPPDTSDPLELEQISMLAGQGGLDEAIGMLERRLTTQPRDDGARRMLASLLFKRAQTLQAVDPSAARVALQRCLKLEPGHADAAALLKRLAPAAGSGSPGPRTAPGAPPRNEDPR